MLRICTSGYTLVKPGIIPTPALRIGTMAIFFEVSMRF